MGQSRDREQLIKSHFSRQYENYSIQPAICEGLSRLEWKQNSLDEEATMQETTFNRTAPGNLLERYDCNVTCDRSTALSTE